MEHVKGAMRGLGAAFKEIDQERLQRQEEWIEKERKGSAQ